MAVVVCQHCGQPIAHERLGVVLTPLKAAIVDAIKRHGDATGVEKHQGRDPWAIRGKNCRDKAKTPRKLNNAA
jgi:hypothetical protein